MKRKISVFFYAVALSVASFAGGMAVQYYRSLVAVRKSTQVISLGKSTVVVEYMPNRSVVKFTSDKLLAPDTYIGYGIVGSVHNLSAFDEKKYNPKGVDVNRTISLLDQVVCLDGITGSIYAENYTLTVHIALSHLDRRNQIVEQVADIINNFDV